MDERKQAVAAKALYETGEFSYRDVCDVLSLPYRTVYNAVNAPVERKNDTRLTEKQVRDIKKLLAKAEGLSISERRQKGLTQAQIATKFKIHQTTVSAIGRGVVPKYQEA